MEILVGKDLDVAQWCFQEFDLTPTPVNRALGIVDKKDGLVGAILWQCWNGHDVQVSYYGPWTATIGIARGMARVAIGWFDVSRVTVLTSKRNKKIIRFLTAIGFAVEGAMKCYYGREDTNANTAIRLVMFRDQIEKLARFRPESEKENADNTATGI